MTHEVFVLASVEISIDGLLPIAGFSRFFLCCWHVCWLVLVVCFSLRMLSLMFSAPCFIALDVLMKVCCAVFRIVPLSVLLVTLFIWVASAFSFTVCRLVFSFLSAGISNLVIVILAVVIHTGSCFSHYRLHCCETFLLLRLALVLVEFVSGV